jgi:hypothetical protein
MAKVTVKDGDRRAEGDGQSASRNCWMDQCPSCPQMHQGPDAPSPL